MPELGTGLHARLNLVDASVNAGKRCEACEGTPECIFGTYARDSVDRRDGSAGGTQPRSAGASTSSFHTHHEYCYPNQDFTEAGVRPDVLVNLSSDRSG